MNWILPALAAFGFVLLLLLPIAASWILRDATATAQQQKSPIDVLWRTVAFFFSVFGGWGFVIYLWACCAYSQSKGRARAWGLLAIPAATSFVCLTIYGNPAFGLLSLLGLPGFLVPLSLPVDRVLLAASKSSRSESILIRLGRDTTWVWALGLFVGVSWAYGNSFAGEMTLDNKYIIEEYFHQVVKMMPPDNIYQPTTMVPLFFNNDYWWPKGISGLYRPVAVLSYWLNYTVNHMMGNEPLDTFQYHVVNLFLHWIAACLGFVLMRQLTRRTSVAFFTALLFATHPIATESVSNIIGRSDILAAIAVFACLSLYIRSTRETRVAETANENSKWRIAPWLAMLITSELIIGLILAIAPALSFPTWVVAISVVAMFAVPAGGFLLILSARKYGWTQLPWLMALMAALAVGLFAKESAIAVVGLIVIYDCIYRWTMEDLRCAIPSLFAFSLISAVGAIVGLWIGQFGALGLSEGLTPVLVILLLGSLLTAGGLALAWVFWVLKKPIAAKQMLVPWLKFFLPYLVTVPPILLWLAARRWVFANASPPETPFLDNPIRGLGFLAARMTASDVFLRLLSLLVWPLKLSCDYSFNQIPLFSGHPGSAETWLAVIGCLSIAAIIGLIFFTFKRSKVICFLLVFYLIAYLPTSNFIIIIGSIMAERFLYLPLLAFVACVVLGAVALSDKLNGNVDGASARAMLRSSVVYILLTALAMTYGVRAWFRNNDWKSDVTLWTSAAANSPVSFRSYQSLAFALYEQYANRAASGFYKTAPELRDRDIDILYETAQMAKPIVDPLPAPQNSSRLYLHLGMYYSLKGSSVADASARVGDNATPWFRRAEKVLQQGVVIDRTFNGVNRNKELARKIKKETDIPDVGLPPIYSCLGAAYARLGEWEKSAQAYQYMRHLDPTNIEPYIGIATAYANEGRVEPECIAVMQALLIDGKQSQLWAPLAHALAQIDQTNTPPITQMADGRYQIHIEIPEVRSVLCSAYQSLVRTFILSRREAIADQFRETAINSWKFSPDLFKDLVTDPNAESPVPPAPDP